MEKKSLIGNLIILVGVVALLKPTMIFAKIHKGEGSNWNYPFDVSSKGDSLFTFLILLMIFIILMIYFIGKIIQKRKLSHQTDDRLNLEYVKKEEEIDRFIPKFNLEEFKNFVFFKYQELEKAYMNFDYDFFKKNCTRDLYLKYQSRLDSLKKQGYQNKTDSFRQITFRVDDLVEEEGSIFLKIRTKIWCHDYLVDKEESIVEGNPDQRLVYEYEMIWTSSNKGSKWLLSNIDIISQK